MISGKLNELPFDINLDIDFKGISIDTRTLKKGNIFIAITGDNFDGNQFSDEAIKKGAVAVIGTQQNATIQVQNTLEALFKIAKWWRDKSSATFIAITGSNGKTTTKEILLSILSQKNKTLATSGNLNNHLGVPLTLCQLSLDDKYAIVEMGANHIGEITPLAELVRADIAIITNAYDAHLGEFGSLENIVKTKGELYQTLNENNIAIMNDKSIHKKYWLSLLKTKKIYFFHKDIYATNIQANNTFDCNYQQQKITINLHLLGKHNIENSLIASLTAIKLGLNLEEIKTGIEKCKPTKGRLKLIKINHITFIDDSYNANPTSMKASLEVLNNFQNNKIAVLGDMAELGEQSKTLHQEIGNYALKIGIKHILTLGNKAKDYQGLHFKNHQQIAQYIIANIHQPTTILVKASRLMQLEKIIDNYISLT
ncbi:UDP-N-acetylmuramoylalanyl-D-glutamyl-2,6-diaminopimelate--D-alanyl-D-alanine ligase [hydrothermal vent metagenome]|uniref:UDP-MurNAc-pentapeptide synthetase n=1 Tax=hydrothermal vent metagenome TaxID=652676 RepID=A0A1W1CH21_9ZZZZ